MILSWQCQKCGKMNDNNFTGKCRHCGAADEEPTAAKTPRPKSDWKDTHIAKLENRANALRSIALELVAHVRQYEAAPELRLWADDTEKRVWEAEGLNELT